MGLDVADDDFDAGRLLALRGLQHGEGFADAGGIAEENFQFAAARLRFLGLHASEQLIGIGSWVGSFDSALFEHTSRNSRKATTILPR